MKSVISDRFIRQRPIKSMRNLHIFTHHKNSSTTGTVKRIPRGPSYASFHGTKRPRIKFHVKLAVALNGTIHSTGMKKKTAVDTRGHIIKLYFRVER